MKRIYLCKFAKLVLTVYRRAVSAIRNKEISNSYYGLPEWQIVLSRVQSNGLLWKTCVLVKAFWMVKHVTFPDFSGILVFGNFVKGPIVKGPIQYSLVQIQQWRHQNNVPNMFTVNIKETRMTWLTSFCRLYCC